jgi:hypothetical protein
MPDAGTFLYDVFLSHSAKDRAVVREIAEQLRKDGVKMWLDEWVLKPGDSIPAKIEEGVERSRPALHVGECVRLGLGAVGVRQVPLSRPAEQGAPLPSSARQLQFFTLGVGTRREGFGKRSMNERNLIE